MKIYDVVTKKTYQKDGVDKALWFNVGKYKETDDGKKFLELNMFPTTSFYIFEQKPREDKPAESNPVDTTKAWDET